MSEATVTYNPFEPGFTDDPYPHYRALREADPVHHSSLGVWLLFRYEDVFGLLRDPSLSVEDRNAALTPLMEATREAMGDAADRGNRSMLNLDPPDHTRLRRLVSKAFTPRMIERLRPRVEELVDEALDDVEAEWNLIDRLAFPLPFQVITDLLGAPETETTQLREWSGTVVRSLEPVTDPEMMGAIAEAGNNIFALVSEMIDWKRANPGDDLLTGLIAAEEDGEKLTQEELADQLALLYIAGHETTVNLIGNGTLALLRHRNQLERLRSDPALDTKAIDELLRFDSPVQNTRRITLSDITVGGKEIPAGAFVVLGLASSNRDPDQWGPTAENLYLDREGAGHHLSFGGGQHFCLGSHLARLEGEVAITRLIRRFPHIHLAGDPEWNGRINLRGMTCLPVRIT
jgi:cytochrome P450